MQADPLDDKSIVNEKAAVIYQYFFFGAGKFYKIFARGLLKKSSS